MWRRLHLGRSSALVIAVSVAWLSSGRLACALSNVNPDQAVAWSANAGWFNCRPDAVNGVEVFEFVCAGHMYSANVGWVNVGSGVPLNGIQYQNNSASDFGVNVDASGNLRGFAYGANIGWINFENIGAARVDLHTGKLSGFAWGANIGWINLGDASFSIKVDGIDPGSDTDGDGIPDAWELTYAGDLNTFNSTSDFDNDGQSDLQEYLAGTDPTDPNDYLHVIGFTLSPDKASASIIWASKPTRQYQIQTRAGLGDQNLWLDSGLGVVVPDGTLTTRTLPAGIPHEVLRIEAIRPLGN